MRQLSFNTHGVHLIVPSGRTVMNSCKLSLAVCSLSAFLALDAVAQSAQPLTARANAIRSAGARSQSPSGQSGTAVDFPCRENAFGSTPETRGKLVTMPTAIHKVQPKYPPAAKTAHIEGVFRSIQTASDWLHGRFLEPGARWQSLSR